MNKFEFMPSTGVEAFKRTSQYLLDCQQSDGSIVWDSEGKLDPWDHCESAMGLSVAGELDAAKAAYRWLQKNQLEDGSWWANYRHGQPVLEGRRETNFVAYIATGIWHYYLVSRDSDFAREMFCTVKRAIDCVLSYQSAHGEIAWAFDARGRCLDDALVTGCSSIYKSLECAINLADLLDEDAAGWSRAYHRLGEAIKHKPQRFDRSWESKARYSMDWFYPILAGIYEGEEASARLDARWDTFVRPGMGCLCVSDEPWVTVAESCELTMALVAAGRREQALELYSWLHQWTDDNGVYWTGYQYKIQEFWPVEKTSWTSAAVLLAADSLFGYTGAARLFAERRIDAIELPAAAIVD